MKPASPVYSWSQDEQKFSYYVLQEDGSLLIWHNGRIVKWSGEAASTSSSDDVTLVKDASSFKDVEVNDMAVDPLGRIWVALLDNGMLCIEPDTIMQLLPGHQVQALAVEGDSLLMANTQNGLYVFNLPKPGPSLLHLQADSTVRYHLSQADGLLSSMVVGSAFSEKKLWMAHPGGVTALPRHLLRREPPVPQVMLTHINYNGIKRSPTRRIELDSNQRNIGFAFSAMTYSRPHRVKYRYRLEGYEEAWSETNQPFVQYAGLPSGAYTFEVQASSSKAQFGQPVSYSFSIPQPFYQHPAFWMAILAVITMLMYAMHKSRVRSILQVERTRTQIAMDLHDDIGSSLTSLSFLSNLAWQRTEQHTPREEISPLLQEIGSMSSELVDNMLDIVWSVDPKQDTVGSVVGRLKAFYQRMDNASEIAFNWHIGAGVEGITLSPRSRRNLYLILKEAVNNAVKHSNTSQIEVKVNRALSLLEINVRDFGRGFDQEAVESGYGLKTMRERAKESGGRLSIVSKPGESTTVHIQWPVK